MCSYKLVKFGKQVKCNIQDYFNQLGSQNIKLPIDNGGLCLFHSTDIQWKTDNSFSENFNLLFNLIEQADKSESLNNTFEDFDLRGITFIGQEYILENGATKKLIEFNDLKVTNKKYFSFEGSIFHHSVRISNCNFPLSDIDFKKCKFHNDLMFNKTIIKQLSLDFAEIKGGLNIASSEFKGYIELCDMDVKLGLDIHSSTFQNSTFFINSVFDTSICMLDNNQFDDIVDFSQCTFKNEFSLEGCTFEKELRFTDATFKKSAIFQFNNYNGNVLINSNDKENNMFNDYVYFKIRNEEELNGQVIFENINFSNIVQEDRVILKELTKFNKVKIGNGCIKYRVQTEPIKIQVNSINENIIKELTLSFTNYFVSSNGFNLGVEFIDKKINNLNLFYFTDEDISLNELYSRLKISENKYWDFSIDNENIPNDDEIVEQIDNYVSKIGILTKIGLRKDYGLWTEKDTLELLKSLPSNNSSISPNQINIYIENIKLKSNMKIKNVIANDQSNINIIEKINYTKIENSDVNEKDFLLVKDLLLELDEDELNTVKEMVTLINDKKPTSYNITDVKNSIDGFFVKHSIPISESLTASVVFEILRSIFVI